MGRPGLHLAIKRGEPPPAEPRHFGHSLPAIERRDAQIRRMHRAGAALTYITAYFGLDAAVVETILYGSATT